MILNKLSLVFFLAISTMLLKAQQGQVKWLSWEEALEANQIEKRKIVVDVYTEWCTWCMKMDKATFQNVDIADYLNENYYAVKFDAEHTEDIIFNNKIYKYVRGGFGKRGHHELAAEIMNGRLSFPTVVFIDEDLDVIQPIPGFQDAKTFEMIMSFFAGDHYTEVPWKKFTESYQSILFPQQDITPASVQPKVQTVRN